MLRAPLLRRQQLWMLLPELVSYDVAVQHAGLPPLLLLGAAVCCGLLHRHLLPDDHRALQQ